MNTENNIINWASPNALDEIANKLRTPLESIIAANKRAALIQKDEQSEIIISSSKQIQTVIEELLNAANSDYVDLSFKKVPDIFKIYETTESVKSMCSKTINPENISKTDQKWLINLENEIYNIINHTELSLFDIACKLLVSERQLHRKVVNLISLTPSKYVRVLKLNKAKQLIENYIYNSVSQIAYAVGYNDSHYFSKLFHSQYKVMPQKMLFSEG